MKIILSWMGHECILDPGNESIAGAVLSLFPSIAEEAPGDPAPNIAVSFQSGEIVVAGPETTRCPDLHEAVAVVERALTLELLRGDGHHTHLHASAAAGAHGAVLAVGRSGAGKSTLAYHWSRTGHAVFGDDIVALDAHGRLHAFPRPLKVDAARLRDRGEDPERTPARDPSASDVWIVPDPVTGWGAPATRIECMAAIEYRRGRPTTVEPLPATAGLRAMLDAIHRTGAPRSESLDRLIRTIETARIVQVVFGDAADAARILLETGSARAR